ncbi:MAG: glycosyltransferase, partial [Elusimicrobia bacterium]|nr:glycosyltransferase [Elusimicrobiota bacterium]MBD3412267.1 glycosyltransferase [Elusimicrobiota bacterium]
MPKVSVIMNCLNGALYLREAIDSVYAQTFTDWEIIFWDNASTDESPVIARSYDERIRYFRGPETVPLGKARNLALDKAAGSLITFLDCDDIWCSDKLEKQVGIMNSHPDIGFIYSNYYIKDELKHKQYPAIRDNGFQGMIFDAVLDRYRVGILTVMIRHEILKFIDGYFDESLTYASDYDLFLRILHDHQACYLPDHLAVYRLHEAMYGITAYTKLDDEIVCVMEKFKRIYPNFENDHRKQLDNIQTRIRYSRTWQLMAKGDLKTVRTRHELLHSGNIKLITMYFASFMPV